MKITTTFGTEKVLDFKELLYINGKTQKIIFEADLNNKFNTYLFFKNIANFVSSKEVKKSEDYFQFAVYWKGKIAPIKWFDIVLNDNNKISHDIAFETTLISKNGFKIPFGRFPMCYWNINISIPKYREFNVKNRAYKYIANQIKNLKN